MNGIGENIKKFRKAKGLTQEQLAMRARLSTMSIRRYETNERTPNVEQLRAIAASLDVFLSDLTEENRTAADREHDSGGAFARKTAKIGPAASIEAVPAAYLLREHEQALIADYRKLNERGKRKASEYLSDLTEQPKYLAEPPAGYYDVNAAHERTDIEISEEMRRADEKLMDDENF